MQQAAPAFLTVLRVNARETRLPRLFFKRCRLRRRRTNGKRTNTNLEIEIEGRSVRQISRLQRIRAQPSEGQHSSSPLADVQSSPKRNVSAPAI